MNSLTTYTRLGLEKSKILIDNWFQIHKNRKGEIEKKNKEKDKERLEIQREKRNKKLEKKIERKKVKNI